MAIEQREKIVKHLTGRLHGHVRADEKTVGRYATDQSIYRVPPLAVAFPEDIDDIVELVRFARDENIPLTPRSGGSGTAGGALGPGIVIAFSRSGPISDIIEIDDVSGNLNVEASVLHDTLQRALHERNLFLPADPSSGAISLIGGNIATKASGPHALKHGSIDRYLKSVRFVTAGGEVVDTADPATIPSSLVSGIDRLKNELLGNASAVSKLQERLGFKTASGYNLFTFVRDRGPAVHVTQLLAGSVGTLGVITGATFTAERPLEGRSIALFYFSSLEQACDAVASIKEMGVDAIEIMNNRTLSLVRENRPVLPIPTEPCHMLLVEYSGPLRSETGVRLRRLIQENRYTLADPPVIVDSADEQEQVWKVRKALLPLVRSHGGKRSALSVVNDVGVPVVFLARFIGEVEQVFDKLGLQAAIYGHAGSGNLHLRPFFDTASLDLKRLVQQVAEEIYETVFRYGGTVTAEHGMGRLRAPFLRQEWGENIYGYMREVKAVFDPGGILNPGAMFSESPVTDRMKQF